jgi:hypothetical protein
LKTAHGGYIGEIYRLIIFYHLIGSRFELLADFFSDVGWFEPGNIIL